MSWRIVMIEKGDYLRLKLDNLFVQKGSNEYTVPLNDVGIIVVSNLESVISSRLLNALGEHNISLVICDYKHQPSGVYTGLNTHSRASKIFSQQIAWKDDFKDYTWSVIVYSKIKNQRDILQKNDKDIGSINLLNLYLEAILVGDTSNREGHSAKVYFNTMFGKEFTRSEDNITNACLNYGYAVIRALFARLIVAYGYTGMLGLHHKNEYNNFNLADDLMEPFRPIYDAYIIKAIHEDSVFDFEMRHYIIEFLYSNIKYQDKNMLMMNAIEKYVQTFSKYCKTLDIKDFIFPEVML